MQKLLSKLNFQHGLIPAVIVDADSSQVLTLCYLNEEALQRTLESGFVHVFRRSRGRVMKKGETSGHTQQVREVRVDCADNSILIAVKQHVAACHAGYHTCYYRRYESGRDAFEVVEEKLFEPDSVHGSEQ